MNDRLKNLQPVAQERDALGASGVTGSGPVVGTVAAARASGPTLAGKASGLARATDEKPSEPTCRQCVYCSIFFDGTGNNLKYDTGTFEHSNVAKMWRAHQDRDPARGVFRIYVPGIGTPFPEVGDSGQGPIPYVDHHNGMGGKGQARLDWAFAELEKIVRAAEARALNPTNKIVWVRLAVFGFSRGATLARAFTRDLFDPKLGKTVLVKEEPHWKGSQPYPISVEFMGLWDTVASVGMPMSANNAAAMRSSRRVGGNLAKGALAAAAHGRPELLRAIDLAFGAPGADPAPGGADGHGAWAEGLAIPRWVKSCVHMIAGHEIRNSFPVDSVQRGLDRGGNCEEYVYPGAHSDVGGGYRPGEGGKGAAAPARAQSGAASEESVSVVPLWAMYEKAIAAGVPLYRRGAAGWTRDNDDDFAISPELVARFNHYMSQVGWGGQTLGSTLLAHTRFYFAWRWYRIARGRGDDKATIERNQRVFAQEQAVMRQQKFDLVKQRDAALLRQMTFARLGQAEEVAKTQAQIKALDGQIEQVNARMSLSANDDGLLDNLSAYDAELVDDARSIRAAIAAEPARRNQLRPHYRNLVETYEDEFVHGRGLRDEKIVAFFDEHIHDSLAGFAKDSTLPSDPRVVYLGGDRKYDYARDDRESARERVPA